MQSTPPRQGKDTTEGIIIFYLDKYKQTRILSHKQDYEILTSYRRIYPLVMLVIKASCPASHLERVNGPACLTFYLHLIATTIHSSEQVLKLVTTISTHVLQWHKILPHTF